MTILHRHLLKELLLAVGMTTGGLLFVFVVGNVLKGPIGDALSGKLPWHTFLEVILLLIPGMAPYVLPIAIVAGIMIVLGRMSAQNEITAMKASGMSIWRIAAPIVAIGLVASLLSVFVNFQYAPWATDRVKRIASGSLQANPVNAIEPKTPLVTARFVIYADSREGESFRDVWIWRLDKKTGRDAELIRAARADLSVDGRNPDDESDDQLVVHLTDAVAEQRDKPANPDDPESVRIGGAATTDLVIPIRDFVGSGSTFVKKLGWYTFFELMELRKTGFAVKPGAGEEERFADRIRVQLQIQSNLANAFGILSLTLLAIPLGIRVSRSETVFNFAVALALALVYYLATVSIGVIRNPYLRPDILVWIPNLVIQGIAAYLLRKAAKS